MSGERVLTHVELENSTNAVIVGLKADGWQLTPVNDRARHNEAENCLYADARRCIVLLNGSSPTSQVYVDANANDRHAQIAAEQSAISITNFFNRNSFQSLLFPDDEALGFRAFMDLSDAWNQCAPGFGGYALLPNIFFDSIGNIRRVMTSQGERIIVESISYNFRGSICSQYNNQPIPGTITTCFVLENKKLKFLTVKPSNALLQECCEQGTADVTPEKIAAAKKEELQKTAGLPNQHLFNLLNGINTKQARYIATLQDHLGQNNDQTSVESLFSSIGSIARQIQETKRADNTILLLALENLTNKIPDNLLDGCFEKEKSALTNLIIDSKQINAQNKPITITRKPSWFADHPKTTGALIGIGYFLGAAALATAAVAITVATGGLGLAAIAGVAAAVYGVLHVVGVVGAAVGTVAAVSAVGAGVGKVVTKHEPHSQSSKQMLAKMNYRAPVKPAPVTGLGDDEAATAHTRLLPHGVQTDRKDPGCWPFRFKR